MSRRPLSREEAAAWQRVIATVEPLAVPKLLEKPARPVTLVRSGPVPPVPARPSSLADICPDALAFRRALEGGSVSPPLPTPGAARSGLVRQPDHPSERGLDGHWDRRLAKGSVQPDLTVDLHGHSLSSAYALLDQSLGRAIASHLRIILLITGKPRPRHGHGETGRGAIRAAVADWLAASRHAGHIAAVRAAHPRHGGQGALYLVLKRRG
ncbi:MAG: Smr/MutS family protein [Blastomonas sp.]